MIQQGQKDAAAETNKQLQGSGAQLKSFKLQLDARISSTDDTIQKMQESTSTTLNDHSNLLEKILMRLDASEKVAEEQGENIKRTLLLQGELMGQLDLVEKNVNDLMKISRSQGEAITEQKRIHESFGADFKKNSKHLITCVDFLDEVKSFFVI